MMPREEIEEYALAVASILKTASSDDPSLPDRFKEAYRQSISSTGEFLSVGLVIDDAIQIKNIPMKFFKENDVPTLAEYFVKIMLGGKDN